MTTPRYFSKKRSVLRAVQWTGEMTPAAQKLLDQVDQAAHHGGPLAVGDWICSTTGEDNSVIPHEAFRETYEEVDADGRPAPPTADEHEQAGREFVQQLDALLADGLRLSREKHPDIFQRRNQLTWTLRRLLEDHAYVAAQRELARVRDKIKKELWP